MSTGSTVIDALNNIKAIMSEELVTPEGLEPVDQVLIFPSEDRTWNAVFKRLPVILVSRVVGEIETIGVKGKGQAFHEWYASIDLLLFKGEMNDAKVYAATHIAQDIWQWAIADVLFQNGSLRSAAAFIGDGRTSGKLVETRIGHIDHLKQVYWGVSFLLRVFQTRTAAMISQPSP